MSEYLYVVFPAGRLADESKQRTLSELLQKTAALRVKENEKQSRKAQTKAKRETAKSERERADRMKEMQVPGRMAS